jgi:pimeloyl-ACP methyl ester carboxylesterase
MRHRLSWMSDTGSRGDHRTRTSAWDAEVPLDRLAAAPFRKLVVSGAWDIAPPLAREIAGSAFGVICDVLEKKLPAERVIFRGAAHNPQLLGNQFNDRLRNFLATHSRC